MDIWILLDSSGTGGIESHVAELAAGLAGRGERPTVLLLQDHDPVHPLKSRLAAAGVRTLVAGGFRGLLRALREQRPAVLHTHGYKAGILGRAAAAIARTPCVSTYHAGESPPGMVGIYDRVDRWTGFGAVRVAVSEGIRRRVLPPCRVVPNFVAVPPGRTAAATPPVVAFVGRMSHEKGPDLFCDIARLRPGPRFVAFGDGPMRAACERGAADDVEFKGAVAGMDAHWAGIGLLAVTSRAEGLPLAALEAMAHGVPVACFAVGGLPAAVRHGVDGFVVPAGDVHALASAITSWHFATDSTRSAMAASARERVATAFGRDAGVELLLIAYADAGACAGGAPHGDCLFQGIDHD